MEQHNQSTQSPFSGKDPLNPATPAGADSLLQPIDPSWNPDERLVADAELGRSLEKVVQQLQWLQAQKDATSIDGHALQSSINELLIPGGSKGSGGQPPSSLTENDQHGRVLVAVDTAVGNWQELSTQLPANSDLLLLERQNSGLQQLGELLQQQAPAEGYQALILVLPQALKAPCSSAVTASLWRASISGEIRLAFGAEASFRSLSWRSGWLEQATV